MEDKIMKKVLGILAAALTLAACAKLETEGITITATLSPKTEVTKAVNPGAGKIVSAWAQNEKIAILYMVGSTKYAAEANIDAVNGDGSATISFTVNSGTTDGTACTLVYPASAAKDDNSGVKDAATLLAAQDGTLNANLDVRVGAGKILMTTTPSLDVTTQPAPQFAIFKFTTKNAAGTVTVSVDRLVVSIDTYDYVVTPAPATSELYAALPATSSKEVKFTAFAGTNVYTNSKAGVSFDAGKYYQSTVKLNASALKALVIPKGTSPLKGDKVLFYADGDTYKQAADRPENKSGDKGWGTWSNGSESTMFFKEKDDKQADLSIDGEQQFGASGLNNPIDPSLNYYFVGTY
ncbi:MAG: hypothetical protein J6Y63_01825 [Bacteroidales bacterium]|nr:hypothetical protein [Bacteroidales bacterium]